jgi:polyisoprenoid-binding protein YceI
MAWTIDPAHTTVGFAVRHLGLTTVRGKFTRSSGQIDMDPTNPASATGEVVIEAASIDTGDRDRDAHLRSADFFDVERYPNITFKLKRVKGGGERFKVIGDLTMKDVTREIELDAEYAGEIVDPYGRRKVGGSLTGTINRSDWGLTWNAPLEAGGWLVSDAIKIEVEGQLIEAPAVVQKEETLESSKR